MAVCAIVGALGAHAQTPSYAQPAGGQTVGAPLMGMVLDRNIARLRPVYGVSGAAVLGAPLETGDDIGAAAVAANGQYALVISAATSRAAGLFAAGPTETPLAGVPEGVSPSALSPEGTAAALYYAGERTVRVVTGLPGTDVQVRSFDVSALPAGKLLTAVSDDGRSLLYSGDTEEVFLLGGVSGFHRVALNGVPTALAFRRNSHDAVVATAAGAEWLENTTDGAAVRQVAIDQNSLDASYIGISRDGAQAYFVESTGHVALGGQNRAARSPEGGADALACSCDRVAPQPAAGGTGYILSEYEGKPISVLDAGSATPRVYVIPAVSADGSRP